MDTTTAIIQFIGIVLFSANVPGDPGIHAILPRIGHVHNHELHALPKLKNEAKLAALISETGVENHVPVIMYRSDDRLDKDKGGWKRSGPLKHGWQYVLLDGERIEFRADGTNAGAALPDSLPRAAGSLSCSRTTQSLRAEYRPPYKGASAVIDVPFGRLSNCEFNSAATTARIDTTLLLDTSTKLVIHGTDKFGTKTIELAPDAVVYVANVPPYALIVDTDFEVGEPHWTAYNDMLSAPCGSKPVMVTTTEGIAPVIPQCDKALLGPTYVSARKLPPMDFQMIDSGCSNAQTP